VSLLLLRLLPHLLLLLLLLLLCASHLQAQGCAPAGPFGQ
jgi:hypothetical protein